MAKQAPGRLRPIALIIPFLVALSLVAWQVEVAVADAPQPNPLTAIPGAPTIFAPVPGVNIFASGPAATIHGNPAAGQKLFATQCASCHNDRGLGNLPNPGSNDGTVPSLNPIDPGFYGTAGGDPTGFAQEIDLFVQHGSRPAGPNPQLDMVPWGDHKLLSQQQIADVEAYVMQLNGVYWPDRWAPPAEIQVTASQEGNLITYQATLINQGGSAMGHLDLSDTLPAGLTYVSSYLVTGQNPGRFNNGVVEWINDDGVSQGGTFGPFVVVAQSSQSTPPPNTFQLTFTWTGPDGTLHTSSAVSDPTVPRAAAPPSAAPAAPTPAPATTAAPTTAPASTPTAVSASSTPLAPTTVSSAATPVATVAPSAVATTAPTPVPTATPAPAAPQPASVGAQIVQPSDNALSWGYQPPTITIHVGDTVIWTNASPLQHTVTADDSSFDSGMIGNGATWSMTFNTAGTYSYHCAPHPWMKGNVVVQ
jgi:amicyanin